MVIGESVNRVCGMVTRVFDPPQRCSSQPKSERARWAFRWLSRLNEVIAKGLATQLIGQTQYLRQQVERLR